MIMEIHSKYGVLKCTELESQAIENSISEEASIGAEQDIQGDESSADE